MAQRVTVSDQLEEWKREKEPNITQHPRYSEYIELIYQAHQAWHRSVYWPFVNESARSEACEKAARLRAEEQRLYAEMTGDALQEVLI